MSHAVVGIDTAGPSVGLGLVHAGGERSWSAPGGRGADAVLVPTLAALLDELDEPLGGVAVSVGPGAFTGLRVGLAVATGLALSRGVPVFAVGSLAARALLCPGQAELLVLLDARKSRFYGARFSTAGSLRARSPAVDAPLAELLSGLPQGTAATGEGAAVAADALAAAGVTALSAPEVHPALAIARWARAGAVEPQDPATVRIRYVRPPDAKVPRRLSLLPPER